MKKKNYLMALLLFLMGTAAMAQVTAVPKVSTATEKHYYTFANNTNTNHNVVTQNNANQPFKTSNTEPAARFIFEQVYDESGQAVEGAYYIKSTRLNAYLSHKGLNAGNAVKYSATAGETERWTIVRKAPDSDTDLSVAVVSYNTKDNPVVSATGGRMGWNPSGGVGGFICLWYTVPTSNLTSFWQMSEVEIPTADFTAINSLDGFQNGWYQLKTTVAFQNNATVTNKYASCVPVTIGSNHWIFTLSDKATPSTLIYIEKSGSNYHIKSSTGRYANANVTENNTTAANLTFTLDGDDNTQLKVNSGAHVWAGWLLASPIVGSSSGGSTNDCRFQLSDANNFVAENYDVYTVNVTDFSDNRIVPVQCNIADYEGVNTVYHGGVFFFEKGLTVQASDFSVEGDVCNIAVDASAKTITISRNSSIIATAQALAGVTTFSEEVGYMPEIPAALTTAITTAQRNQTYANLLNLRNQYNAALSTIVMPVDGKAYYLRNKQQSGDGFLLYRADNGTLATKAYSEEGKDYASTFVCHRLENGKYIFVNGQASDYLIWRGNDSGYNSNKGFLGAYDETYCSFTLESRMTTQPGTFTLLSKRADGSSDGTIVLMKANGAFDKYGNSAGWSDRFSNLFILEEADYHNNVNLREPRVADEHSYASLYLPFAATVPEGVEVFTATRENSWLVLNPVEGTLPAGTAVVVRGTEAGEALFVPAIEAGTAVGNNVLQGTVAAETTPADTYVLSGAFEAGIGFYPYTAANLPVGKAYLTATDVPFTGESGVKGLLFGNGGTTGIGSAVTDSEAGAVYYDLSGRRVLSPAAGIYIRNGKKVFVK